MLCFEAGIVKAFFVMLQKVDQKHRFTWNFENWVQKYREC